MGNPSPSVRGLKYGERQDAHLESRIAKTLLDLFVPCTARRLPGKGALPVEKELMTTLLRKVLHK
jgi:hypothetical protein